MNEKINIDNDYIIKKMNKEIKRNIKFFNNKKYNVILNLKENELKEIENNLNEMKIIITYFKLLNEIRFNENLKENEKIKLIEKLNKEY